MKWTEEQRTVRALLLERHVHGMGREIARELSIPEATVYFFKRGEKPFPKEKLGALQQTLDRRPLRPPRPVRERRPPPPGKAEQQAVRTLLVQRYVHGMGREIAREVRITPATLYRFKKGRQMLSKEKLASMREFLLRERSSPQVPIRELLVHCLSRRVVSGAEVARRFRVHRSTVSRFKEGMLPFPSEQLEELAAYLRTCLAQSPAEPVVALAAVRKAPRPVRLAPRSRRERAPGLANGGLGPPMRVALIDLATRFAEALIEAVRLEPLRELPALPSRERGTVASR